MTDAGMGIQPTYNLAERDNDGFGDGFGAWFWVILILLFCNNVGVTIMSLMTHYLMVSSLNVIFLILTKTFLTLLVKLNVMYWKVAILLN